MNFLVMSHLRWDFVFQRPQHLLTRCSRDNRVFFWEEPILDAQDAFLEHRSPSDGLHILIPHLPAGLDEAQTYSLQRLLLAQLLEEHSIAEFVLWYYTPMAVHFTRDLSAQAVVYDCMDELSAFRGAPPGLRAAEAELFSRADLVFTGGQTLFQSKRPQHPSVHCFPSSIDRHFFSKAREIRNEVADQAGIPRPRLGFCGVIDERLDISLLGSLAAARPDWHFVLIGPVVKIAEADLPHASNIHYLGAKQYQDLPTYLAGWDVGLLPFALNESTRFISPTKTPEYLAAGLPVVSTAITDVVTPYGVSGLVHIAASPAEFIAAVEAALPTKNSQQRLDKVDKFLSQNSWDLTWSRMARLIAELSDGESQSSRVAEADSVLAD
jgi:glycosyltransferase involved in cell wall biosynthesis